MLTLTTACIEKQAQSFLDNIHSCQFKVNGILVENVPIFRKERTGNVIRVYVMIDYKYTGTITEARIKDKDGLIVIESSEIIEKPANRGIYMSFKYKYLEKEVVAIE